MKSLSTLMSLKGRSALVFGGAGFLGREISEALAELGANVVVASRDLKKCQTVVEEIKSKAGYDIKAVQVDISSPSSVAECFEAFDRLHPQLDILVNCAWSGRKNSFQTITEEDWKYDIDVCLTAVFRCIKQAHPRLIKSRGVVLNVASMYGHVAPDYRLYEGNSYANPPSYGAAKAGIIQLTKYCASFLAPEGIRVNCLSPGPFPFESTQKDGEFIQRLSSKNPMGRIGQPHELKGAAALLCTDASSYMTGQNVCVDGGWGVW